MTSPRRHHSGDDVPTRLLAHPVGLYDTETADQLITLYGADTEPLTNLIVDALQRLASSGTSPETCTPPAPRSAMPWPKSSTATRPWRTSASATPPRPVDIDGHLLPTHQPVDIACTARNDDPAVGSLPPGNRARLACEAVPHSCPAHSHAHLIAGTAISHVLGALPELGLARTPDELARHTGPFHRPPATPPVAFPTAH